MEDKKIVSMLQEFVKDNYDKNEHDAVPKNWVTKLLQQI